MPDDKPLFVGLDDGVPDGLLALLIACRDDPRPDKLDLGIGVYRDEQGATPVMRAVKAAERRLVDSQRTKTYLGGDGDTGFVRQLAAMVFGAGRAGDERLAGMQTPGGTGALRLVAELLARHTLARRVWMSTPTWSNHHALFRSAGVAIAEHPYYDPATGGVDFDAMVATLEQASEGDALLLHGCCHNPTGADLTPDQWFAVADLIDRRRLIPVVDLAYQGLGHGLNEDAFGARLLFDRAETLLLAYSCDKNFGLYRERTGALWVRARDGRDAERLHAAMRNPARSSWSMPPDHGAAVVRTILEDAGLTAIWHAELDEMRERLCDVRRLLADSHPRLAAVAGQSGIFSLLPIPPDAARALRDQGIYLVDDGRINVAGLNRTGVVRLARAIAPALHD